MSKQLRPLSPIERKWGMTIHFAALLGLLLPLGLVLGPLIVWLLKRHDNAFYDEQGKKAVNFQLTILLIAFAIGILSAAIRPFVAVAFMAGLAGLIYAVMAGYAISKGRDASYPFSLRIFK